MVSERAGPVRGRAVRAAAGALALLAAAAGVAGAQGAPAAATAGTPGAWVALFDGKGVDRWRGYKRPKAPTGWKVRDRTLVLVPTGDSTARGDLVSREQYGDFELEYEWRVQQGSNSGVMWRVSEDQPTAYMTGPEQQVLDDDGHIDGKYPTHRAGALYDLVEPPPKLTRPVGEFNRARIVARGSRVQLYLNGTQTADFDFASAAGRQVLAKSKFATMPRFASNRSGHIVLQDHGDPVAFRNIRIRPLGAATAAR